MQGLTKTLGAALVGCLAFGSATLAGPAASADRVQPLLIGAEVPRVTLKTVEGEPYELATGVKKKPTVLIFYRGGW